MIVPLAKGSLMSSARAPGPERHQSKRVKATFRKWLQQTRAAFRGAEWHQRQARTFAARYDQAPLRGIPLPHLKERQERSDAASAASAVIAAQSPRATASFGATQDPPTHRMFGRLR